MNYYTNGGGNNIKSSEGIINKQKEKILCRGNFYCCKLAMLLLCTYRSNADVKRVVPDNIRHRKKFGLANIQ